MDKKKFAISFVAVYVVYQFLNYLIHGVWLSATYAMLADTWRPDIDSKLWILFITSAVWCLFFCYIYVRGCEGKGIVEGVRYGVIMGLFFGIPHFYDQYALYPVPYMLALKWFLSWMVVTIICGIVVALIYKPAED